MYNSETKHRYLRICAYAFITLLHLFLYSINLKIKTWVKIFLESDLQTCGFVFFLPRAGVF